MMPPEEWTEIAACRGEPTDTFFPNAGEGYARARRFCFQCPVRMACLVDALGAERELSRRSGMRHGMFGGATPDERASMKWLYDVKVSVRA